MNTPAAVRLALLAMFLLPAALVRADEAGAAGKPANASASADAPSTEPKKDEPRTETATRGDFPVVLDVTGVLDAKDAWEGAFDPQAYGGELKVLEAAEPGPVTKGATLVRLDPEKIDELLVGARRDLTIAELSLGRQTEDASRATEAAAIALEKEESDKSRADEALERFTKTERDLRVKEAEHGLEGMRINIVDQEEELAQLRKMYEADDMVEGTEEIVLRRAERGLARSKDWLAFRLVRHTAFLESDLPRELESLRLSARRETLELERLRATQASALEQARLELERTRTAVDKQKANLAKLEADRALFTLVAGRDGLAVPGACVNGKWSAVEATARTLRRGETLRAKQVVFTIVTPGSVLVRTSVPEASVLSVRPGKTAKVTVNADADRTLEARVATVASVSEDGAYPVTLEVLAQDARFLPGFTAKAKVLVEEKKAVVTVPSACVVADGEAKVVHVFADGTSKPRKVETGATSGGRTEIRSGLEAGERVLATPPKS